MMNNASQAIHKLEQLLELPQETEWAEFKHNNSESQMIGEYLSALSNSAALEGRPFGYIAWGVDNGTRNIVGTSFKPRSQKGAGNEDLEPWLNKLLAPKVNFRIFEFEANGHPMVMFEVQAANTAPVSFRGCRYVRVGSHKKPLGEHPEKERKLWILLSGPNRDWSAQICTEANLNDLDLIAIDFARQEYKKKHPALAVEVDGWNDVTFLNKAKVCINGEITRTAILLLGKNESEHYLSPSVARISWVLKDVDGISKDYQHFGPPLILAVNQVFDKVRNLTYRYLPDASLFPTEVTQYDPWVIRETLHNCIAHQDYQQGGKINVVEQPDSLLFTNVGTFLPGSVEEVVIRDAPPEVYPNRFLAEAMVNLNMIDTIGSGIKRMFTMQRKRNFPMPDYELDESNRVKVGIAGKVLDEKYTRMLQSRSDLDLLDVIGLDKVQKGKGITHAEFKRLKEKKLIEGRRPNLFVSAAVAAATESKAEYIKNRAFNKEYYQNLLVNYLKKYGQAKREDIDNLLFDKLSDALDDNQKRNYIMNLLQKIRRNGTVKVLGKGGGAVWQLHKPTNEDEI